METTPSAPPSRRFLVAFGTMFVVLLAMPLSFNIWTNPYGEWPTEIYRPLTGDVLYHKLRLFEDEAPFDTLVLGSSRIFQVWPDDIETITGGSAFNFGYPSAIPSEQVVLLEYAIKHGAPKELVFGLDLNFLSTRSSSGLALSKAYPALTGEVTAWHEYRPVVMNAYRWITIRDGTHVLWYTYVSEYPFPAREQLQHDGAVLRPNDDVALSNGTYDFADAINFTREREASKAFTSTRVAEGQVLGLGALVDLANSNDVRVRIFFTPLHPTLADEFEDSEGFQLLRNAALSALLPRCGPELQIYDLTRVESFGGNPTAFYDGWHIQRENTAKMMQTIYAGDSDLCLAEG